MLNIVIVCSLEVCPTLGTGTVSLLPLAFFFFFFLPCGLPLCWGTLPLELVICWTLAGFLASPAPLRIEGIFWITNEEKSFEKHLKLYLCPHSTA